jgi:hypothetical protein
VQRLMLGHAKVKGQHQSKSNNQKTIRAVE